MSVVRQDLGEQGPSVDYPSTAGFSFNVIFNDERNEAGELILDKRGLRLGSVGFKQAATATEMTFKVGNGAGGTPTLFAEMGKVTGLSADLTAEGTFKIDDLAEWDYFVPILDAIGTGEIEVMQFAFR